MNQKISYSIKEAAAACGLGRTKIYELIKAGELRVAKVGSRTLILKEDLEDLVHRNLAAA